MQFNSREAAKNREWQEKMSNTSYQRAVKDLKKAGLNPILRATGGLSGSSTPSGAAGSISQSSIGRDAMSSRYGISGLMEGLGQIIGAVENSGLSSGKAENVIVNLTNSVSDMAGDMWNKRVDFFSGNKSSTPSSRTGGFRSSNSSSAKGASFKTSPTTNKVKGAITNLWG